MTDPMLHHNTALPQTLVRHNIKIVSNVKPNERASIFPFCTLDLETATVIYVDGAQYTATDFFAFCFLFTHTHYRRIDYISISIIQITAVVGVRDESINDTKSSIVCNWNQ